MDLVSTSWELLVILWGARAGLIMLVCLIVFIWTLLPVAETLDLYNVPCPSAYPIVGHLPYFFGNLSAANGR